MAVSTGGPRSFAKSRFLRAVLNNVFRRTTAVARDGLPRIFEVDLYPVGGDFARQILVTREKFGHANRALDVREAFFIIV